MRIVKIIFALLIVFQVGAWAKEVVLTEVDKGGSFTLDVGDTVKIVLDGNPTTGFCWELVSAEEPNLKKINRSYMPSSSMCGAGGTYTFTFKAESTGDAVLQLTYSRPWEKGIPPAKTFDTTFAIK